MLEAHDDIAAKNYDDEPEIFPIEPPVPEIFNNTNAGQDAIRMVGIRKTDGESLVSVQLPFVLRSHPLLVVINTKCIEYPIIKIECDASSWY